MRHGARIFGKLNRAQLVHIFDALDRARTEIRGKLLVPKYREAFLQTQLKPVTAGHAVARPVVKILMTNHCFHALEARVCRRIRPRQHTSGVEDVQPLVLHCPHVEVIHRDDHEDIQIVFATEPRLIPGHGALQRAHRVITLTDIVDLRVDTQRHLAS